MENNVFVFVDYGIRLYKDIDYDDVNTESCFWTIFDKILHKSVFPGYNINFEPGYFDRILTYMHVGTGITKSLFRGPSGIFNNAENANYPPLAGVKPYFYLYKYVQWYKLIRALCKIYLKMC